MAATNCVCPTGEFNELHDPALTGFEPSSLGERKKEARTLQAEHLVDRTERIRVVGSFQASRSSPASVLMSAEKDSADDPLRLHGIKLRDSADSVSLDQLAQIESRLGFRLPAEYRSFLLCANGGIPEPNRFRYTVVDHEEGIRRHHKARITRFLPAIPAEAPSGEEKSLVTFYKDVMAFALPDWLLPIAVVEDRMEGGMLCIAVKGKKQGRIYYWPEQEIGEDTLHRVADSFALFLALLAQEKTKDAGPASAGQKPRTTRAQVVHSLLLGIRADQYTYRRARLPYVKFPRDPDL